ncbi:hypothetical protein BLNAU_16252 [Blattamonas nauphoetae]|uniref:Protein kinase domain-containing protein n=1 Tax=Blattamonas nauphoetae TaxID=2049346 RepID=A0ABQ9X8G7_9EUKA|nr:hypothetical protein BLNAU_16252 [Blattamonas nauphoetae]
MNSFLVTVTTFLSLQSHFFNSPHTFLSPLSSVEEAGKDPDCHNSKILRLIENTVILYSIQIRSEEISFIGNNSSLLFQGDIQQSSEQPSWSPNQASTKSEPKQTPNMGNYGLEVPRFMFDVLNSTFSMSEVHAIMNSERNGICSISGSTVRFSSSSITSNGDSSPFVITTSENEGPTLGSTVILADVTHHSMSNHVAPFVGLAHPHASLTSSPSPNWSDFTKTEMESITIIGTDLSLESKHLIGGTGPLFSFGLTEQDSSLGASGCTLRMETSLVGSSLLNVSSSSQFSAGKLKFGSEVCQRVAGCCVDRSTNHDSGTGMMSPNLGGNLMCSNSSFSSCIRQQNNELEYSLENRTQTVIGRLNNVTSDVTSVSFSHCTFNEMAVAVEKEGGGAIFMYHTSSTLTITTCFFHKCTCTEYNANGGAVNFRCTYSNPQPSTISESSFTECSSGNCGGSVLVYYTSTTTIDKCFFELSESGAGGAIFFYANPGSVSNCAFVDCSTDQSGGALMVYTQMTASFSFVQFRGCSTELISDGRDIHICLQSTDVMNYSVKYCDSTSGTPNVYFEYNDKANSTIVPQISSTPTIKSVDVTFDGDTAKVTVETDIAIKGTLGVLLDGSNVPRLVHVVFGEPSKVSTVGTAIVSSGANGILPDATTYTKPRSTLAPFQPPTIRSAESTRKDWNTTEIIVKGIFVEEGSYWMLVEKEGQTWNISLEWQDSTTLTGTAPLHPSTAKGRLEWETTYEVTKGMWLLPDGVTEEECELSDLVTFTTPDPLIRITSASSSLEEYHGKSARVNLEGVKLGGGKGYNVTVRKMEGSTLIGDEIVLSGTFFGEFVSPTYSHSELIIGNPNPLLSFETTYLITKFDVDGEVSVVDADVTFSVPPEPARIVGVKTRQLTRDRTKMIVLLEGRALLHRTGKVTLTDSYWYCELSSDVVVQNDTHCTAEVPVGEDQTSDQLQYGEEYTVRRNMKDLNVLHVEDGITLVVPHLPEITEMKFSFSNTLHTGCLVKLTGTNLIVGESMKITLNDSLSFIATVTSETNAQSTELPIGRPSALEHDTTYEVTSIEATETDQGKTLLASGISDTTGSLPDDFIFFVDSGPSSESTLFCGDRNRPCKSIEDGWKIVEGVGISKFSISIIHNTTQNEQVRMEAQHEVLIESGPTTTTELSVSPSSLSEMEGEGMIEVSEGRLRLRDVDVLLSDLPSLIFIRMIGGHLTLETCTLVGLSSSHTRNEIDTHAGLCLWESGILNLVNATTTIIKQTDLTHLSQGAINMKGGNLTIRTSSFEANNPRLSNFPSLRRNIRCSEEGAIEIGSLSGGDGSSDTHPHLWLSHEDCVLSGEDVNANAPFFIPTLSSSSTSKLNSKKTGFEVSMNGTTLIPCSLYLEVFEKQKDGKEGKTVRIPLSENSTESFNETLINVSLPLSSMDGFEKGLEWCGRLVYGQNETTTSFVIQKNSVDRAAQAVRDNMKWWLPLVISLSVLFILVLVVIVVCCRRRRDKKNGQKEAEMTESDQLPMEDEKMDIVTDNRIGVNSIQTFSSSESNQETQKKEEPEPSKDMNGFENVEEVLVCSGDMKKTAFVSKDRTLYNALHSENKWDVRVRQAQQQLVKGLKGVMKKDGEAVILRTLTAHNIFFDSQQNVCLKLNLDVTPQMPQPISTQQPQQEQLEQEPTIETNESKPTALPFSQPANEGVRWYAPEVIANKPHINSVHGAVFSLGLILWEMETGCVPYGEQDAVNASRQIVTGVRPKLELVENKDVRELISQCLSLEPDDRPDLDTIENTLSFLPPLESINPNALAQA